MGTIHANNPRDSITRLENMIALGNFGLSDNSVRRQIAAAIGLVVQVARLKDGSRRVVALSEITGMKDGEVAMRDLITFDIEGEDGDGKVIGQYQVSNVRPKLTDQAACFNQEREVLDAMGL